MSEMNWVLSDFVYKLSFKSSMMRFGLRFFLYSFPIYEFPSFDNVGILLVNALINDLLQFLR